MSRFVLALAAFAAVAVAHSTADACWLTRGLLGGGCGHGCNDCYDYCGCDCGYSSCGYSSCGFVGYGYASGCAVPSCAAPAPSCCAPAPSCCAPSAPSCAAPAAPSCCAPCGCH